MRTKDVVDSPSPEGRTPMSPDALHALLTSRFREVFGDADRGAGCQNQWSLHPFPGANSVTALISGSHHQAVWVFDPHTPRDPVHRWPVVHESQIEEIIGLIFRRLGNIAGARCHSPIHTVSAREQEQFDRGATDLLHAVRYSHMHRANSRSVLSTTARKQRAVREAVSDAAPPDHVKHAGDSTNAYEVL
jgi:hypothetical protein